jgi:hypothetical protein
MTRTYAGVTEPVRGDLTATTFVASGSARTLYDVEAPRTLPVVYRVTALKADGTGEDAPATVAVTLDADPDAAGACDWWAAPLSLPRLTVVFEPENQQLQTFAAANGVFRAAGRADPIVLFGTRQTATGDLSARCASYADAEVLRDAIGGSEVMVVRAPAWAGWAPAGRRYVAVDTLTNARLAQALVSRYSVAWPWTEVLPPLVPVTGWGSQWDDVTDAYATWAAVPPSVATWDDLTGWVP